ncbi:MAG: 2-deoxycytidine 5-triphosphate deaminase [Acidimicrobiaceae bacterium]|nr:2-deoxycytidine 5-triphosphate deaminase [Acidimicrobiaceae bacterium]
MLSLARENGVLPVQALLDAKDEGYISGGGYEIPLENFQPASLDLRLDQVAYRIRCSFLPGDDGVERRLKDYVIDELDLRGSGAVLEAKRPFLIPLKERLALPDYLHGKTNPKSSTGRLDVFTRVITENGKRFDEIPPGYGGRLYLEVVPLSFPIRVREHLTLNQLRLAVGSPELSDDEVRALHATHPILYRRGRSVSELPLSNGLFLGIDLKGIGSRTRIGYRAKRNAPLLDMTSRETIDTDAFWETIYAEQEARMILDPNEFYLIMSEDAVSIPPTLASEMTAYDPTSGELRTHYAGFFDPGFGYDPEGRFKGSRAALEIRAHDVPFLIEHGQPVCKLTFEHMIQAPLTQYGSNVGSNYQQQTETLSKYFLPRREADEREAHSDPRDRSPGGPIQLPFG